ncbi:MAG: pilus assembly protein [Parvibaculum sp.]|nr:pilus assembly protein [Parvibaculum sp.]
MYYLSGKHRVSRGAPSTEGAPATPRFARDNRGSVAIEFAFVAAVFLAILFGIMSYGFQFATRIALSYAVTEGGRAAVAGLDPNERQLEAEESITRALEAYRPLVDPDNALRTYVEETTEHGIALRIRIDYTDTRFSLLPFIPTPAETMRIETTFVVSDPLG